jgi:Methyltransferase domain
MPGSTRAALKSAVRGAAKRALARVPVVGRAIRERDALREELSRVHIEVPAPMGGARQFVPPGHFYSPIPSLDEVRARAERLFGHAPRELPGIDLREPEQVALLESLRPYYDAQPFPERLAPPRRYWFENPAYSYSDAIFLHCMIRHARPRRMVEIGSGHSSCVILDTNELHFGGSIACTFVEPYPELLRSLMRPGDEARVEILEQPVQSVDPGVFARLEANDILFIDSTHVSKVGSDVNHLLFEVLPRVAAGVYVHFHDVFFPFEYPREWILEGRTWSEAYLLRAFLTMNACYELVLFNTFLERFHAEWFERHMPLCLRNPGGSIWIRRAR